MADAPLLEIDGTAAKILERVESTGRAWVTGPVGSGRTALLTKIAANNPATIAIELSDLGEADAIGRALLMAAADVATPEEKAGLFRADTPTQEKARQVAEWLVRDKRQLLVWIPASWLAPAESAQAFERNQLSNGTSLLKSWWSKENLRVIFFSTKRSVVDNFVPEGTIGVPTPCLNRAFLQRAEGWGSYRGHASALDNALKDRGITPESLHPLPVRLAVGALALGVDPARVVAAVKEPSAVAMPELSQALQERLRLHQNQGLAVAIQRFLSLRVPVDQVAVQRLTGIPDEHLPLITDCVGYANPIRCSELTRKYLGERRRTSDPSASWKFHAEAADRYAKADGESAPWALSREKLTNWLEKLHHYAMAGPERSTEWAQQEKPGPEFYWDRARALSKAKCFEEAAGLYRQCVASYPSDDYGWHYLAFNLQRAGMEIQESERAFRTAIAIERGSDNPWWNCRLVTFLIGSGRISEAASAWRIALAKVDPDGERVARSPWLAENLHYWVAKQWLDAGRADLALEVVEKIPAHILEDSDRLAQLRHAIRDAREEEELGVAVYPFTVPIHERWKEARFLPEFTDEGVDLDAWFVGQIVESSPELVRIAYASSDNRGTLKVAELDRKRWKEISMNALGEKGSFLEMGTYGDGSRRAVVVARSRMRPDDLAINTPALAYIQRWHSQPPSDSTS